MYIIILLNISPIMVTPPSFSLETSWTLMEVLELYLELVLKGWSIDHRCDTIIDYKCGISYAMSNNPLETGESKAIHSGY